MIHHSIRRVHLDRVPFGWTPRHFLGKNREFLSAYSSSVAGAVVVDHALEHRAVETRDARSTKQRLKCCHLCEVIQVTIRPG
jgi:hypothetical protein